MEHRSPKFSLPKGKNQLSCIWALVDMFDFRNARRTNQKLLLNGGTMQKHGFDAEHSRKVDLLANFCKKCQGLHEDGSGLGNHNADEYKTKIKDIMQEEFPTEKQIKKLLKSMKHQCKRSDFESIHQLSNNHKKASKSSKKEKSHLGNHQCLNADEFCLDSHNFAAMLEEICSQIHQDGSCNGDIQRSISPYRCKQLDEINVQLLQMSAKAFIDQIYINRRYMSNDTASSKTKPFSDAAEILHLNRDLFLKLLQDPNCLLVKHIQKLQFPTKEKERINKFFLDSKSSESQRSGIGTFDNPESVMRIQKKKVYGLLWKKFRPRYGSSSKGNTNAVANEIVVLKTASKSKKNAENVSCHCSSSLESQQSFRNKGQNIKSTYFSLKEIKRRFKQAMGESQKQEKWIPLDGSLSKLSREKHSLKYVEKGVNHNISIGESAICSDAKRQEKQQKSVGLASSNGYEIDCNNEAESKKLNSLTTSSSKKQQFDIFAEAKRHLSERLKTVNVAAALRGKQSPRTLQMILSSPDHDFLVTRSPNRNTSASVSAQMRFSPYNNIQKGKGVSCISPQKQNEEVPPFADFVSDDQSEVFKIRPKIPEKIDAETGAHKNICDIGDDLKSSGSNILQENESMLPRNLNILEVPYEPNVVDSICCGPCIEAIRLSEDTGYRNCSSADVSPEDHHRRSLLEASSSSLDISALEIADICKFREDHPSPVSVLEPFSPEDAYSPIIITHKPDQSPLQPRCIDFDDHSQVQTPEDPTINVTACNDEEEYMQAYVRAVMQASNMNFEDLSSTSPTFPHILNAYAVDSVGLFQVESHCDLNLLLDCIHEVLIGVCQCYFGYSPWLSFLKQNIRPAPLEANIVDEVVKEVNCFISPKLGKPTLDQLAGKDVTKSSSWLELRPDTEDILIQIAEDVLQDSMVDTILEFQM